MKKNRLDEMMYELGVDPEFIEDAEPDHLEEVGLDQEPGWVQMLHLLEIYRMREQPIKVVYDPAFAEEWDQIEKPNTTP